MRPVTWSKNKVEKIQKEELKGSLLVVASFAEPYLHNYVEDKISVSRIAGGVITALEPILKATKGLWVAYGRGAADRDVVDSRGEIRMPPNKPSFTLKRLWFEKKELRGWYYGFSNQALWPLCHNVFERPTFNAFDWQMYVRVNQQFADAILQSIEGKDAVIWVHDYHLALVPSMIRQKRPDVLIGFFWHIPWPVADLFQICPWTKEILEGLLGCNLIGFQRTVHCKNFLASIQKTLEAKVDFDAMTATYANATTHIKAYPISVDSYAISRATKRMKRFGKSYIKRYVPPRYEFLSLGVERLEYTKGLLERFKAIDVFLDKYPEFQGRFVHINVLAQTKMILSRYEQLSKEIDELVENINFKHRTASWRPIHLIRHFLPPSEVYSLYKSSDVLLATSLADGMNLVAKEYVAAGPSHGVLILSNQAGAADELQESIIVNPYDIERLADAIKDALTMPEAVRKERMEKLKATVSAQNVYRWAGKFLVDLSNLRTPPQAP